MTVDAIGVECAVEDGVLRVSINRPARMNAVTTATLVAIADAFDGHAGLARVGVLTGVGRAFCTGADLADGVGADGPPPAEIIEAANRVVAAIRAFPAPVIGAVNGPAAGVGVSLALACDLTVAAESSYLLLAFTKIGLMPDGGASALVAASIGRARALKLALLAERLPAAEALRFGLIADVFEDEEFSARVDALAAMLAAGSTDALSATKDAVNDATLTELDAAFARERSGQLKLLMSADFEEGILAFREKRPAVFGRGPDSPNSV